MNSQKGKRRTLIILLLVVLVGLAAVGFYFYRVIQLPNSALDDHKVIYIPSGSTFAEVTSLLLDSGVIEDRQSFENVAQWMKYSNNVKAGKYQIDPGWSNRNLVRHLRAGNQAPVNLVINNVRTINELAGKIGRQLELDSTELVSYIMDPSTLEKYKLNANNILSLFIPNTYQLFWTTPSDELVARFEGEHNKFWTSNNRDSKAQDLGMSRAEVYALASIVEKETQLKSERARVAGLYLNRIELGMPLQADPTVVFATKKFDLRRVLNVHLKFDSPYNTYLHRGVPPGPIYMPSISSLDAVLDHEKHDYIYMCAKPDNSGTHAFAASSEQHGVHARAYRRWLDSRGIR